MWPARKSRGGYEDPTPERDQFAVSHSNTTDMDYGYDASGRPIATGLRVRPIDACIPGAVRSGALDGVGHVIRVVRNRRPGRPTIVWVNFPFRDDPDRSERHSFYDRQLLVIGSPSGM